MKNELGLGSVFMLTGAEKDVMLKVTAEASCNGCYFQRSSNTCKRPKGSVWRCTEERSDRTSVVYKETLVKPQEISKTNTKEIETFKNVAEIYAYLLSFEGAVIVSTNGFDKLTLVEGNLFNLTINCKDYSSFRDADNWKPYIRSKEWWELRGDKPTLCWYGDYITEATGLPQHIGFIVKTSLGFQTAGCALQTNAITWGIAIPVNLGNLKDFLAVSDD